MQLVLDTNGLSLKKRNNSFWIVSKKHRRVISPHRVSSIAVIRDCLISTAAMRLAIKHKIPIFLFNYAGKAEGSLWSPYFGSIATIRRNQLK
ncbi:MAG: CRISPR-associated endonuclease Cas1, partial [Bacteroidota bacterium]